MDGPTIFHLNFVQILEEVADHFHLEPPVISTSALSDGGIQGAVHVQVTPHDPGAYTTFYGYGEDDHEAGCSAAHEALKSLYFSLNFGLVDLHSYEYWETLLDLACSEQQHQEEIAQLQQYHEVRRKQELDELEQEHQAQLYEIKHDHEIEVEDRDRWIEEEGHKTKKLKQERDEPEDVNNKQESEMMDLKAENWCLRQQLVAMKDEKGKN
ncbi:hypothetical protein ACQJBY_035798 [Aegilops geniculata]